MDLNPFFFSISLIIFKDHSTTMNLSQNTKKIKLPFHVRSKKPKYTFYKLPTLCGKQPLLERWQPLQRNTRLCRSSSLLCISFLRSSSREGNVWSHSLHQAETNIFNSEKTYRKCTYQSWHFENKWKHWIAHNNQITYSIPSFSYIKT